LVQSASVLQPARRSATQRFSMRWQIGRFGSLQCASAWHSGAAASQGRLLKSVM
jgi:hypothetical protein